MYYTFVTKRQPPREMRTILPLTLWAISSGMGEQAPASSSSATSSAATCDNSKVTRGIAQ